MDGAEFRAASVAVGTPVQPGDPIASFSLDDKLQVLRSPASGVLLRVLLSEPQECAYGHPIALLGDPHEQVGYEPTELECVRLLLLNRCTECGNDYPVNGLVKTARCTRCGDVQHLSRSFWKEICESADQARRPGTWGGFTEVGGPTVKCHGLPPLCRKCFTLIEMDALNAAWQVAKDGARTNVFCTQCGESHSARKPPAWALESFPDVNFLIGEVTGEAGPDAPKPVIFKCPSCLAALEIAGEKRIVRCRYCESDVYLPDDLWLHFNPAAKRARWWMLFTPGRHGR